MIKRSINLGIIPTGLTFNDPNLNKIFKVFLSPERKDDVLL
jgi:hypothetical protein